MKKLLCIILSCVFVFSMFSIAFADILNEKTENKITAEKFASDVNGMLNAYDISKDLPGKEQKNHNDDFSTARLIVKSKEKIDTLNAVSVVNGYDNLWVLQFSSSEDAKNAYNFYSEKSFVEFVEADREVVALSNNTNIYPYNTENDEDSYLSWGTKHIGMDILKKSLLSGEKPLNNTVVAVIDTGVDDTHPNLKGRVIPTRINTSSSGIRNSSMDDNGHGTQIAGVIADSTVENIYIKPYKVLDSKGSGTLISLAAGINCAVNDGVDIINISVGFKEESDILKSAIDNAEMNDILVIGAAGNDGTDSLYYPASYDNVVKVTAINESNIITNFSTYGNNVDFAAPGIRIKTTTLNGEFITVRGTSIAAPFVSSVAATIRLIEPDVSIEDIKNIMADSAIQVSEHNAEKYYGKGVINAPQYPLINEVHQKTSSPYFSHRTYFSQTFLDVEIYCDTPDAEIYYTTDRSVPSKTNPAAIKYNGTPIHATQTIILMAVAYSEGKYRSSVSSFASIIAPYAPDSSFTVTDDGTLISYSGSEKSFTIPEKLNGITVRAIGSNAFENNSIITEVILPDTVTEIRNSAFKGCENLKTIYTKNTTFVGDHAFDGCIMIKNLFLISELQSIGKYSFAYTGSKQNLITGSTFRLLLNKLTDIPEGAFSNSSLSEIDLGSISSIGTNAFSGCNQLVSVYIDNLFNMPRNCFKGCESLTSVEIHGLTYIPASAFYSCYNLSSISLPDATNVTSYAFEDCSSLVSVNLPKAETIYSNAFKDCTKLSTLYLPAMKEFETAAYKPDASAPQLPQNLETFIAPSMAKTVPEMFRSSPDIKYITLNSATDIAEYTFSGCHKIYSLNIGNVQSIKENTFDNCTIAFIDARNLVTTADMPENSGILLSNNFLESTDSSKNLTVYGTSGTFIERYCNLKGYKFIEIPLIYRPLPEFVTENSETVYVIAVGFDLSYQWYWNTVASTKGGTPIDGATTMSYTFTSNDTAPYYYCEITQNDLGKISKITTNIIAKDTKPADYTEYNKAVENAKKIDRKLYSNIIELDKALNVDVSNRYSCEQSFVDEQTKAINDAIANLKIKTVDSIELYASKTTLTLFDETRIITITNPRHVEYKNIEYSTSNENIVVVFQNGYVWCVGNGTADITVTITNLDDSVTESSITFECKANNFLNSISYILRMLFILASRISNLFK
ncbi:MAG: leucine-rich repeat protein [Acutalibacteraceae bacterium]|nr:leucine-rich repeat protein [Acutalibacteraceae bacterium]